MNSGSELKSLFGRGVFLNCDWGEFQHDLENWSMAIIVSDTTPWHFLILMGWDSVRQIGPARTFSPGSDDLF